MSDWPAFPGFPACRQDGASVLVEAEIARSAVLRHPSDDDLEVFFHWVQSRLPRAANEAQRLTEYIT